MTLARSQELRLGRLAPAFVVIIAWLLGVAAAFVGLQLNGLWRLGALSFAALCLVGYLTTVTSEIRRHLREQSDH